MKIINLSIGLVLLLFSSIVNAQKLKSTVRASAYPYSQVSDKLIREYDKNENLIKQVIIDFRGIPTRTSFYILDDKGRMISDSTYNSDNKLIEACSYEYNDHDDIIFQKRLLLEQGAYYEERYDRTYDSHGNQTEVKEFNKEGELGWVYKYRYDSQGNEKKRFDYFKGTAREEWSNKIKNGNCVKVKSYSYDNEKVRKRLNSISVYEYDEQGRKKKRTANSKSEYLAENIIDVCEYRYDEAGHVIEEKYTKNGNLIRIISIKNTYW